MDLTAPQPMIASRRRALRRPLLARIMPYLLVAPTFLLVFLFTIWPSIQTVIYSTMEFIPPGRAQMLNRPEQTYVGLQNYVDLFDSTHFLGARFGRVLSNTLIFTFATVGVSLPIALAMALLLNRRIAGLGIWRFGVFYPALLPLIGAANIWAFLYANEIGLINTVLRSLSLPAPDWLKDPNMVLLSVTIVNIWKQAGYYMIFYLAGLQGIPRDIYEAAELDGAGYFQQLFLITLPLLRRTTLFLIIVSSTFAFQTVEQLQALGQGLPADRGNLLLYFIFQNVGSRDALGYINAMTVILVGLLLIFTVSNFLFFEGRGHDDD